MGDLGTDTAVEQIDDNRYSAKLNGDWRIWGPQGGYIASVALRAAGAASPFTRPASFSCHFLGVAQFDEVEVTVTTLRVARAACSQRVELTQDGVTMLEATVWSVGEVEGLAHDVTEPPDVPGPDGLQPSPSCSPPRNSPKARRTPSGRTSSPSRSTSSGRGRRPSPWRRSGASGRSSSRRDLRRPVDRRVSQPRPHRRPELAVGVAPPRARQITTSSRRASTSTSRSTGRSRRARGCSATATRPRGRRADGVERTAVVRGPQAGRVGHRPAAVPPHPRPALVGSWCGMDGAGSTSGCGRSGSTRRVPPRAARCRGGHVKINGAAAKPASAVNIGDRVTATLHERFRDVEVVELLSKRVGAAITAQCYVDHSPLPTEAERRLPRMFPREAGTGRPTKRDRRQTDRLRGR